MIKLPPKILSHVKYITTGYAPYKIFIPTGYAIFNINFDEQCVQDRLPPKKSYTIYMLTGI